MRRAASVFRNQRGQAAPEYLGVLVFAVALGLVLLTAGPSIGSALVEKIRCAISGECGGGSPVTGGAPPSSGDEVGAGNESGGSGSPTGGDASEDADDDDEAEVDEHVADATEEFRDALDGGFFGTGGGDLERIEDLFEGLSPDEVDAVIAELSDDELLAWMGEMDDDGFFGGGWSHERQQQFFNMLANNAGPDTLDRLADLSDDLAPGFADVDAAKDTSSGSHDRVSDAEYDRLEGDLFIEGEGEGNGAHPSDILQGALGDCYLLASLAAVAQENPEVLENMIRTNDNGTYTVTFYDDGDPVEISVTPDLPLESGSPVFSGNEEESDSPEGRAELWPLIVEKAYAQYNESYGEIEGGFTQDALEQITGVESQDFDPSDVESIDDLGGYEDSGHAITVHTLSSGDEGDKERYTNGDLVTSHAYYVTGVDTEEGTVTVRNPWGWQEGELEFTFEEFQDNFNLVAVNPTDD